MMEHKGECKLTIGKDLDFTQVWSFGVAKNFPCLSNINNGYSKLWIVWIWMDLSDFIVCLFARIQLMRQSGLLTRIGKTYLKPIDKCLAREVGRNPHKKSQLSLSDLADVFVMILGLGCVISIIVFLLELLTSPVGFRKLFTRAEREVIILWLNCVHSIHLTQT